MLRERNTVPERLTAFRVYQGEGSTDLKGVADIQAAAQPDLIRRMARQAALRIIGQSRRGR